MESQELYKISAALNQDARESLEQMAQAAGVYFNSLIASGIPYDLALRLVEEWNRAQWENAFSDR